MDGAAGEAIRYLFILALVLIVVAYFAGSSGVLNSLLSGLGNLGLVFTGRNSQGNFAAYPSSSGK